jgi:hypothetical protein
MNEVAQAAAAVETAARIIGGAKKVPRITSSEAAYLIQMLEFAAKLLRKSQENSDGRR